MSRCVSFSDGVWQGDREVSEGVFTVSATLLLDVAISGETFDSLDDVSEMGSCEEGNGRICNVVSLTASSEVLIFESGVSRNFSLFACLVPL